jgi:hypothetical protein
MAADNQVARPVAAPNYVGMYSEGIKGALEPYNYLLNMQKELSEEDFRKGEIQNFLDEHQDKANALAETTRSNRANEAMTALERGMEQQRIVETSRHDQVDETETGRHNAADEALRKQTEDEVARSNQAKEVQLQKDLDLRTEAQKHDLQFKQVQSDAVATQARLKQQDLDDEQNDNRVLDGLSSSLKDYSPDQIYSSNDNPELQQLLDDARRNTRTVPGRGRLDDMVGERTALGRENIERIELNHMSTQAKDAFQDSMLSSAPSGPDAPAVPTQTRFTNALNTARQVEQRYKEREGDPTGNKPGWTDAGLDAYKQAKADGKDDLTAQGMGRMANFKALTEAKEKVDEKPDSQMIKTIVEHLRGNVPRLDSETDDEAYKERADTINLPKAIKMERDMRLNPNKVDQSAADLARPTINNANDFSKRLLPTKPAGSPYPAADSSGDSAAPPNTSSSLPTSSNTRSLMPASLPNYAASADSSNIYSTFSNLFNSPVGSQPGEEDSETATV